MKPGILLDENVSLAVAPRLRAIGFDVVAVAELEDRGQDDNAVYKTAIRLGAILVTRDSHFTNPYRFDSSKTAGIVHIVHGNLMADEECALLEGFLVGTPREAYAGKLVSLARGRATIR